MKMKIIETDSIMCNTKTRKKPKIIETTSANTCISERLINLLATNKNISLYETVF